MNEFDQDYLVPDGTGLHEIKDAVQARCRIGESESRSVTRRFHDTFDWFAFTAGGAVEERLDGARRQLLWHDLRGDGPTLVQELDVDPGFGDKLTPGPVAECLAPVLGIRRLLPLLDVQSRVQTLRLLNDDDKTVVRLEIEENRFEDSGRERQGPLSTRLRLRSVRGYDDEYRQTVHLLDEELGLSLARNSLLLEALAAAGKVPGSYSSKLAFRLDPERRADSTAKEILLHLLDTIEANVPGTKENLDSEFLHDLRVAVRRSRSALTQIKSVFAPDVVEEYKERFGWLGQVTGPVRDLDVYLLEFDDYQRSLPEPLRPHLEQLREFLLAHYGEEQRALAKIMGSRQFRDLLKDWRAFLETPVPERSVVPNAMRSVKAVSDERIWRMYKRVRQEGRAIGATSPEEDLHELRKSCKKLRYLIEFFGSLYPKREIRKLIKLLKMLLDNLGKFQDLAVQAGSLREMAQKMREEGRAETDTLLTMGVLVGDLLNRQTQARAEFAETFATFDSEDHRSLFKALFAAAKKEGKGA